MAKPEEPDQIVAPQEIVAGEITIVDGEGNPRIKLKVEEDGSPFIGFYDKAKQLRLALFLKEPDGSYPDLFEHSEAGLIITDSRFINRVRLVVDNGDLYGRYGRLEIIRGIGRNRRVDIFPIKPPNSND